MSFSSCWSCLSAFVSIAANIAAEESDILIGIGWAEAGAADFDFFDFVAGIVASIYC